MSENSPETPETESSRLETDEPPERAEESPPEETVALAPASEQSPALPLGSPEVKPASTHDEKEMSLFEHLDELRSRCLWSIAAWAVASIAVYYWVPRVLELAKPFLGKADLIVTGPAEAFFSYLKVAMVGGIFVALPVILYNFVAFVAPGLTSSERKWFFVLLPLSIVLFLTGVAFAYFMVLPVTFKFFLSFTGEGSGLKATLRLDEVLGFLMAILALCGVVFQLPLVLLFGALIGLLSSRFLRSQRRIAYFLAFVVSAVATPTPDAVTATVVAVPIILLYEISLVLIWLMGK